MIELMYPHYLYLALQGVAGFSGIGFIFVMVFRMRTFLSKRVGAAWLLGAAIWNCNPLKGSLGPGDGGTILIFQGSYWPHFSLVCSIILFYVAAGYMLKASHPAKDGRNAAQLSEETKV